ncbi:hypothetical protein NONO_c17820 [Nocardia nova SH22a]|uniref:Head-to-tail adaptor n=1 Tax=Nocardia nova SH22a TaxID=1415166 RepID=W5TBJ5_9NOCA|nr:hypothetical protein [Nocardia nova]AHH16582.1 hypothetical protein NONO_c17820 [Nocardia nova SH22a]
MTTPGPLLTLEQFQALVDGTGIEQLRLDAIVQEIRDYCGWHIAPMLDATITVDGSGAAVLQLPTLALNSVTSIAENGTVLPSTEYEWSADGSLRRCPPFIHWTNRYRGVVAAVNHGYEDVPANILSVILDATSAAISTPVGTNAELPETMGPFTFGGNSGVVLNAAQRRVLDRYRLPGAP